MTRWAQDVKVDKVLPEYPRPQLVRDAWLNLNGLWDLAILPNEKGQPEEFDKNILVPFPVESALSGVMERVENQRLWYRRSFKVPKGWTQQRLLLHFGAVDWDTTVWVNGQKMGHHKGGYDRFSFDITKALKSTGAQELLVSVWDPTDAGSQPRGKQVREPENIWYTPTTGIWQTVWLEPVPETYLDDLSLSSNIDLGHITLNANVKGTQPYQLVATVRDGKQTVTEATGGPHGELRLAVPKPKLWSPERPFLYDLDIRLLHNGKVIDHVKSYTGMRKISLGEDTLGVTRIYLNNKPRFQLGLLDQGFWPDGLYTAPTDEALRYDLEITKQLGFNTVRKHVKVESDRWYYWADRLGLLVWQDMPNGDTLVEEGEGELSRTKASAAQFEHELRRMVDTHINHPSIVMWVLFNEGWGQSDTVRFTHWLKTRDPSRLVNSVSGWNDLGVGDVQDIHSYPDPAAPPLDPGRASVLGEFGGLGLPLKGHTWQNEENWGYQQYGSRAALLSAYRTSLARVRELSVSQGLAGAIYTQTTDVETEVNGLLTYDRAQLKLPFTEVKDVSERLYQPLPRLQALVPTAEDGGVSWRYTTQAPGSNWFLPKFNDTNWQQGRSGFGQPDSPGAIVGTIWNTRNIWLRTTFELEEKVQDYRLRVHHDEDAVIYLNGRLVSELPWYTFDYRDDPLTELGRAALQPGLNSLSVHCKKLGFGQYCDVGLYGIVE